MTRALPRVLLYSAAPESDRGGVQGVVAGLGRRLGQRGVVAWPDGEEGLRRWRLSMATEVGASGRPSAIALMRAAGDSVRLARRLAELRPDIVDLHFPRGQTAYFFLLRPLFGYRLVLSLHGSDLARPPEAVARRLPGWLAKADAVTVVSDALAEEVRRLAPRARVDVVPNGIDTTFWSPPASPLPRKGLLAAGRLVPIKGFDVLVRALSLMKQPVPLTLAGEGPERDRLEALARELGVEDHVRFVGRLEAEELRDALRRTALFVLPSRDEGLPLGLLEAMACGAPVVASAVGGVPSVTRGAFARLTPPGDADALASAIEAAGADDAWRAAASEAARAEALSHDAEASYDGYLKAFAEVSCSR